MLTFFSIVFAFYAVLVLALAFGWARSAEDQTAASLPELKVAVVVAFRDEATTLPLLLQDLKSQKAPHDKVEFIMVDDHSHDGSGLLVQNSVAGDSRFTLLSLNGNKTGKKAAIATAIGQTIADVIITTDADCRLHPDWTNVISRRFSGEDVKMLVGPVRLTDGTFFEQLQAMEFCSLVGTARATLSFGVVSMCNGANLAFRRESFVAVGGYAGNETITSGDDDFLMKKFSRTWRNSIHFLNEADGTVTADAAATLPEFFRQRLRWAGKWKADLSAGSVIAVGVLAFHICNILLFAGWVIGMVSTNAFVVLVSSKLFVELVFLLPVCSYLTLRWRWTSFLTLQFIYSFYVVGIGILSQVLTTRWKGREVITRAWKGIS